jgi:hypothetical protein
MRRAFTWKLVLILLAWSGVCLCRSAAEEQTHISVPAGSLMSVDTLNGLTMESSVRFLGREIEWNGTVWGLDGWWWSVGLGYSPAPFLRLGALAGAATADVDLREGDYSREGDYGLLWGLNSSVALLEYVLEESPVFGHLKAIRFLADLEYLHAEPGVDGDDITVEEIVFAPHVVYAVNLRGAERWHPYEPLGVAVRGGIVWSSVNADIDDHSFDEANSFGLLLGADMQFNERIALRLTSRIFSEDDYTLSSSLGYYF